MRGGKVSELLRLVGYFVWGFKFRDIVGVRRDFREWRRGR